MKIKHYDNINISGAKRRRRPLRIVAAVLVVALVVVVGYSLWGPVRDFVNGAIRPPSSTVVTTPVTQVTSGSEPAIEIKTYDRLLVIEPADLHGDLHALADEVDATGVALTLKDSEGRVYFKTDNAVANAGKTKALQDDAVDAAAFARALKAGGLTPVARVAAFKDHIAPRADENLAIRYQRASGVRWLDNAANQGGRPWLNPYADEARQYIIDLCVELADCGFEAIVLTDVCFPDAGGLMYAWYGEDERDHTQLLADFIAEVKQAVGSDVTLLCEVSGKAAFGLDGGRLYGTDDPFAAFAPDRFVLDITPTTLEQHLADAGIEHSVPQDGLGAYTQSVTELLRTCGKNVSGAWPIVRGAQADVLAADGLLHEHLSGTVLWIEHDAETQGDK